MWLDVCVREGSHGVCGQGEGVHTGVRGMLWGWDGVRLNIC